MISAIITTYNRKAFLEEAVSSVLAQSYLDLEIIVVDDGSTDGSHRVVEGMHQVNYEWKENGGISSARNLGISLARGDYVAFLDVDDLWKKEKLAIQMGATEAADCPISYTDEIWLRNGIWLNQKKRHRKYSGHIYERCLPLCIISPSSALIKKEVFARVGLFDESLPACEDYDMWLRICARYPVLFIPEQLIVKRGGHSDQLSRQYPAMDRFRIASMVKMLQSGSLSADQADATRAELRRKCLVVGKGAEKRGRIEEAKYYYALCDLS